MSRLIISLALLALVAGAADAGAAWSHDPETNDAVAVAVNQQSGARVVPDGLGGQLVAWLDLADNTVRVQRFDADGQALWGAGVAAIAGYGLGVAFDVAGDGAGGAFVAVQDSQNGLQYHVYAQHLNPSGSRAWGANGLAVAPGVTGVNLTQPAVTADGSGGAFVAWSDPRGGTADIYAQRVTGSLAWGNAGLPVCTAADSQTGPRLVRDNASGVFAVWSDQRTSGSTGADVYAQRLSAVGAVYWPTNGLPVCTAAGNQLGPTAVTDGQGGFVAAWLDERDLGSAATDIYAQRFQSNGTYIWAWQGAPVCTDAAAVSELSLAGDGAGGAWFAWTDARADAHAGSTVYVQGLRGDAVPRLAADGVPAGGAAGDQSGPRVLVTAQQQVAVAWVDERTSDLSDLYAQLLTFTGERLWGAAGLALSTAPFAQDALSLSSDPDGAVVAAWRDARNPANQTDIYLQRIDRTGWWGDPAPRLTGVHDVPQDQGGFVRLDWDASWLDAWGQPGADGYLVWNRFAGKAGGDPSGAAALATALGVDPAPLAAALSAGWTYLDQVPAAGLAAYGFVAPTFADSTAAGAPATDFLVMTVTATGLCSSNVLGGWSVDNLPPAAPLYLAARLDVRDAVLGWGPSGWPDADLDHFRIYRADAPGVALSGANFLGTSGGPTFFDPAPPGGIWWYYVVTAVDVHGNEGPPSNEAPLYGIAAAGDDDLPATARLAGAWPNPFNPITAITYAVPRDGPVRLDIHDVAGRRVATLVDGAVTAGVHRAVWQGRDASGRGAGSGVYFAVLDAAGERAVLKLVLAK